MPHGLAIPGSLAAQTSHQSTVCDNFIIRIYSLEIGFDDLSCMNLPSYKANKDAGPCICSKRYNNFMERNCTFQLG